MSLSRICCLAAACWAAGGLVPVAAQALKPGLWEIHNKMEGAGMGAEMAQMQKEMAQMPAAERKQMEAMLAQQGLRMAPAGGGMAVQVCMTREMAERNEVPLQDGCQVSSQQRSGNTLKMAFRCTNPPSTGEGQFTFAGPEAYRSRLTMKVSEGGRTETTSMETSGRWLKADCGAVRPPARK